MYCIQIHIIQNVPVRVPVYEKEEEEGEDGTVFDMLSLSVLEARSPRRVRAMSSLNFKNL